MRQLGGSLDCVHLREALEDGARVYLVQDVCGGGSLHGRLLATRRRRRRAARRAAGSDLMRLERGSSSPSPELTGAATSLPSQGSWGLPEGEAREHLRAILRFLAQCHAVGIVYRDVKPSNFLFPTRACAAAFDAFGADADALDVDAAMAGSVGAEPADVSTPAERARRAALDAAARRALVPGGGVKASDFGLAIRWRRGVDPPLRARAGTLLYMAPEVLDRRYGDACDQWSAGVTLHELLTGRRLFEPAQERGRAEAVAEGRGTAERARAGEEAAMAAVRGARLDFGPAWQRRHGVSAEAADLLTKLLDRDPTTRLSASEALRHPWLKHAGRSASPRPRAVAARSPSPATTSHGVPGVSGGLLAPPPPVAPPAMGGTVVQRMQRFATQATVVRLALLALADAERAAARLGEAADAVAEAEAAATGEVGGGSSHSSSSPSRSPSPYMGDPAASMEFSALLDTWDETLLGGGADGEFERDRRGGWARDPRPGSSGDAALAPTPGGLPPGAGGPRDLHRFLAFLGYEVSPLPPISRFLSLPVSSLFALPFLPPSPPFHPPASPQVSPQECRHLFSALDLDGDGFLTGRDLAVALRDWPTLGAGGGMGGEGGGGGVAGMDGKTAAAGGLSAGAGVSVSVSLADAAFDRLIEAAGAERNQTGGGGSDGEGGGRPTAVAVEDVEAALRRVSGSAVVDPATLRRRAREAVTEVAPWTAPAPTPPGGGGGSDGSSGGSSSGLNSPTPPSRAARSAGNVVTREAFLAAAAPLLLGRAVYMPPTGTEGGAGDGSADDTCAAPGTGAIVVEGECADLWGYDARLGASWSDLDTGDGDWAAVVEAAGEGVGGGSPSDPAAVADAAWRRFLDEGGEREGAERNCATASAECKSESSAVSKRAEGEGAENPRPLRFPNPGSTPSPASEGGGGGWGSAHRWGGW